MELISLSINNVRNLEAVQIQPSPHLNLIHGANGSGKSSLLEGLHFLSRARSFRSSRVERVIREGADRLVVFANLRTDHGSTVGIGVERTRQDLRMRIGGEEIQRVSDLASTLPMQVIHPNSHELLEGGPRNRRRFLDWGVFHVEPNFFPAWRRFQRALEQRNAALRSGGRQPAEVWDRELSEAAGIIDAARSGYIEVLQAAVREFLPQLTGGWGVELDYQRGWPEDQDYERVLQQQRARDLAQGFTTQGPHRAEIRFRMGAVPAIERVSRGQQKLLVAALLLSQAALFTRLTGKRCVLLVDDVAAELDSEHRRRLMQFIAELGIQLFVTAIDASVADDWPAARKVFHVEQGRVREQA